MEKLGYEYVKIKDFTKGLYYFNLADKVYNSAAAKYNLCCYYSLTGNKIKALEYLEKALADKFNDFNHIQNDADLEAIRNELRFTELLKKYFPDKFK